MFHHQAKHIERVRKHFAVVAPLDDVPEQKLDPDTIGPMHMSRAVKSSLLLLRLYLVLMGLLVAYHVFAVATGASH